MKRGRVNIKVGRFELDLFYGPKCSQCKTYREAVDWARGWVGQVKGICPGARVTTLHFPVGNKNETGIDIAEEIK